MIEYIFSSSTREVLDCNRNHPAQTVHPDRIMSEHDLIYFISGEWEIWQEDVLYKPKAGDILLLFGGLHHYGVKMSSSDIATYYIHFSKPASDHVLWDTPDTMETSDKYVTPDRTHYLFPAMMSIPQNSALPSLMERVISVYWSRDIYARNRASAYLELILCELSAIHAGDTALADEYELVGRLTLSMKLNPERFYSVCELASMINVSPKTLYNYFMLVTGEPPHEYQLSRKLEAADAELSRTPSLTLRQLAARYGFCDEYHFAKCYKARFNRTPKRGF
jgi:Transcriptional regulator containing an amidase domain and an AraC-type DNA-binding HTH domain